MNRLSAFALSVMVACAPVPPQQNLPTRAANMVTSLPPMKEFDTSYVAPATRSNADMAQDFLDLTFRMESGRNVPVMTRFEGPISVRVTGAVPPTLVSDLDRLLGRLRSEAGIPITRTNAAQASITVEAVPQAVLQSAVPRAACFVVPRISSWAEFTTARNSLLVDWTTLARRERAVIFIPADVAPQEIRDCLHEELAQAIGPLNDLYRLPDSVFNDDNIHTVLTGFDMLMLRTYYAPELASGMSRAVAAQRLPDILARLNPRGENRRRTSENDTTREWIDAMETALTNGSSPMRRRQAAGQAIQIGQTLNWTGSRRGFAYYAFGRLQVGYNSGAAISAFNAADQEYRRNPITLIHAAHIAVQRAAFTLSAGDAEATIALANGAIPVAAAHQNAALLATLMMFKAEALDMRGDSVAAQALRLDSLGWARYGFGSDSNVQARLAEIAALRPF